MTKRFRLFDFLRFLAKINEKPRTTPEKSQFHIFKAKTPAPSTFPIYGSNSLHSSSHLNKQQLATLISQVNPCKVYPIHTENPHTFKTLAKQVQLVEHGKKCKL